MATLAVLLLFAATGAVILYRLWLRKASIAKALTEGRAVELLERLALAAGTRLQPQVFVSHCGQDDTAKHFAASVLAPELARKGLRVVIDFKSLKPGQDWAQELRTHAANSEVFVAVLSKTYSKRFWCMLELDLALNAHSLQKQLCSNPASMLQRGACIATGCNAPLIIPVFIDENNSIVQQEAIQQFWEGINQGPVDLSKLDSAGLCSSEDREWIDPPAWAANIAHMLRVQNLRRNAFAGKDDLLQMAEKVTETADQHIKSGALIAVLWGAVYRLWRFLACV